MGKKRKTHEFEDQFGEYRPQDRDEQFAFVKGSGGGGTAGKSKNSTQLNFQRHVPKFLQPYAHMLGQKQQDEDEAQILIQQKLRVEQEDVEEEETAAEEAGADRLAQLQLTMSGSRTRQFNSIDGADGVPYTESTPQLHGCQLNIQPLRTRSSLLLAQGGSILLTAFLVHRLALCAPRLQEAIQRALEENPELAVQLGEEYMHKVQASKEKELGNKAFADKDYETAIKHFTTCIELDPKNAVYYSNRSAAAANLSRYEDALNDALTVIKLKPGWVKGHARAAAACMGLQLFSEAKEAYEKAVKLEPDDQALQRGLTKATGLELQHMRDRKHVFKKGKTGSGSSTGPQQQQQHQQTNKATGDGKAAAPAGAGSKPKQKTKLSFAMDDDEDEQ